MDGDTEDGSLSDGNAKTRLRLLTPSEYRNSVAFLLGITQRQSALAPRDSAGAFSSVAAHKVTVGERAAETYELSARTLTTEVFSDPQRWEPLVSCQPQADLAGECTTRFVQSFGRRAFRRSLRDDEVALWVSLGERAAAGGANPATALAAITYGILQSPHFLYRVEDHVVDATTGRLRYSSTTLAERLAFLLTDSPPSDALIDQAQQGALDTADAVRAAATALLAEDASEAQLRHFFIELTGVDGVLTVSKNAEKYPSFVPELRASMLEETHLWLRDIVLAPGADVRSFYDSQTTFVDARLAQLYGIKGPDSGFAEVRFSAGSGRAGILGQASFLSTHAASSSSSPVKRGHTILKSLLCQHVPAPPADVDTNIPEPAPDDVPMTTRQRFEQHRSGSTCAGCHSVLDPPGFALENFDPIGGYRAQEHGIPVDARGDFQGVAFQGAEQFAELIRQNPKTMNCLVDNYYRYANGTNETGSDRALTDALATRLATVDYRWRDWILDFVSSEAFRSAPAKTTSP